MMESFIPPSFRNDETITADDQVVSKFVDNFVVASENN